VLGSNVDPEVPVSVELAPQDGLLELYHSTVATFGPVYEIAAVSVDGVCPWSKLRDPVGVTLTVGSDATTTSTTFE
jgi:hypothetical protein